MKKENIPPIHLLYASYKIKLRCFARNPMEMKKSFIHSKNAKEEILRGLSINKMLRKLFDASSLHLFYSVFFAVFGFVFLGFSIIESMLRGLSALIMYPTFISLYFIVIGLVIALDAYAKWLVKIKRIDLTYDELQDRIERRRLDEVMGLS